MLTALPKTTDARSSRRKMSVALATCRARLKAQRQARLEAQKGSIVTRTSEDGGVASGGDDQAERRRAELARETLSCFATIPSTVEETLLMTDEERREIAALREKIAFQKQERQQPSPRALLQRLRAACPAPMLPGLIPEDGEEAGPGPQAAWSSPRSELAASTDLEENLGARANACAPGQDDGLELECIIADCETLGGRMAAPLPPPSGSLMIDNFCEFNSDSDDSEAEGSPTADD